MAGVASDRVCWARDKPLPWVTLAFSVGAVLLYLDPRAALLLQYDRPAISRGELWRLASCHWVHFTSRHILWDVLTLLCLGAFCEMGNRRKFLTAVVASTLLIPAAVWALAPGLRYYRGLSGIDSAAFALLTIFYLQNALQQGSRGRAALVLGVLLLFLGKSGYEVMIGEALFAGDLGPGVVPVPLAHVTGAVTGAVVGAIGSRERWRRDGVDTEEG